MEYFYSHICEFIVVFIKKYFIDRYETMNRFKADLISKFSEPFLGFKLQFIEIEILRSIYYYKLTDVGGLYNFLTNRYKELKLSKSQFYRIIDSKAGVNSVILRNCKR